MLVHYAPPRQLDYQVRVLEHEYSEKVVNYPGSLRHLACKLDLVISCVDVGVGGAVFGDEVQAPFDLALQCYEI